MVDLTDFYIDGILGFDCTGVSRNGNTEQNYELRVANRTVWYKTSILSRKIC